MIARLRYAKALGVRHVLVSLFEAPPGRWKAMRGRIALPKRFARNETEQLK